MTREVAVWLAGGAWLGLLTALYLLDAAETIFADTPFSARPALPTIVSLAALIAVAVGIGLIRNPVLVRRYLLGLAAAGAAFLLALAAAGSALALAAATWITLAAWVIGERVLRIVFRSPPDASVRERAVFGLGIGIGLLSHIVLGLGLLGLVGPLVYVGLLLLVTIVGAPDLRRAWLSLRRWQPSSAASAALLAEPWLVLGLTTLAAGWIAIVLVEAISPELQFDSLYYHLALPRVWLEQGRISGIPYISYSYFYLGTETLYTLAMGLAGQTAARLVNVMLWLLASVAVLDVGRRMFNTRAGIYGALLALTTPLLAAQGASTNVDLAVALFSFLAVSAAYQWWSTGRAGWLIVAGACAGFALSGKLTALLSIGPMLLLIGGAIAWRTRLRIWRAWREIALLAGAFIITGVPWPALQYVQTGNPAFPFLNAIFQSPLGIGITGSGPGEYSNNYVVSAAGQDMWGIGTSLTSLIRLPWAITFDSGHFMENSPSAALGLGFVCLPLLILTRAVRQPATIAGLLLALLCGLAWAFSGQAIRYGLAQVVPLSLLAGHGLAKFGRPWDSRRQSVLPRTVVGALTLIWCLSSFPAFLSLIAFVPGIIPYDVVFGQMSHDAFLKRTIRTIDAYQFIASDAADGPPRSLGISRDSARLYAPGTLITPDYAPVWRVLAQTDPPAILDELRTVGVSYLVIDRTGPQPYMGDRPVAQGLFLDQMLELRYADRNVEVYSVPSAGMVFTPTTVKNIARDSSFKALQDAFKGITAAEWTLVGEGEVHRTVPDGRDRRAGVRLAKDATVAQTVGDIQPDQFYTLETSLFGNRSGSIARLRVDWMDRENRLISTSENIFLLTMSWKDQRLVATAPANAASAAISVMARIGEVWVDKVTFGPVQERSASARPDSARD